MKMFTALALALTVGNVITAAETITAIATAATSIAIAVKSSKD